MSLRQRQTQSVPLSSSASTNSSQTQAQSTPTTDTEPWYRYPLNLILARTLRFLGKFGFWIHDRQNTPHGIPVTRALRVGMRDGYQVTLNIYDPSFSSPTNLPDSNGANSKTDIRRPCVINFHGGGFTIGSATDDSRWARWVTTGDGSATKDNGISGLGALFISIEYRLAPEYPYPVPVEDCIDSTKYIISHAEELGIDGDKIFLSGFSAGGSLAVTTALALSHSPGRQSTTSKKNPIKGVIAFYPVLDFSTPRNIKFANSIGPVNPLPGWLTRMFDTSYLPSSLSLNKLDPMISPGLAPDEIIEDFPECHLCLCGEDVLAAEGRAFGKRLAGRGGREVVVRTVEGARHGWDKAPMNLKSSVGVEYDAAIDSLRRWCQ